MLLFLLCIYTENLDLNEVDTENTPDIPFIIASSKLFIYLSNKFGDDYSFKLEFLLFLNTDDKSKELCYYQSPVYIGKSENSSVVDLGTKILHENFKFRGYFKCYETSIKYNHTIHKTIQLIQHYKQSKTQETI